MTRYGIFDRCGTYRNDRAASKRSRLLLEADRDSGNPYITPDAGTLRLNRSPILAISQGRRAATSIDRYLQKVSLTACPK